MRHWSRSLLALTLGLLPLAPLLAEDSSGMVDDDGTAAGEALTDDVDALVPEAAPSALDAFFTDLTAANLQQKVEAFYSPGALFEDPTGRYEGRERLLQHLQSLVAGMQTFSVDVKEEFVSGEETVALWTATFTHKSLRSGEPLTVDGVSHVRIKDGKVVAQRDYYDLGATVYENVPVLGAVVRWVKGRF